MTCRQCGDPASDAGSQRAQVYSPVDAGKPTELIQAGREQGLRAAGVVAPIMVKRCSDLDDPLEKGLFRFGREQPDFFPGLVGLEEAALVEFLEPLVELLVALVGFHS